MDLNRFTTLASVLRTQQLILGTRVSQDGLKDPEQGFGQLVVKVVRGIYGNIVLQDVDRILGDRK